MLARAVFPPTGRFVQDRHARHAPVRQPYAVHPGPVADLAARDPDLLGDRLPHLSRPELRVEEARDERGLAFRLFLLEVAGEQVLERMRERQRERQSLHALRPPVRADLAARHAPHLFRVATKERLVQPGAEPVDEERVEVGLVSPREQPRLHVTQADQRGVQKPQAPRHRQRDADRIRKEIAREIDARQARALQHHAVFALGIRRRPSRLANLRPRRAFRRQPAQHRLTGVLNLDAALELVRRRLPLQRQLGEPPLHHAIAFRKEAMAADVHPVPLVRERLRDAAGRERTLEHQRNDVGSREEFPGRRQAGRSGARDHRDSATAHAKPPTVPETSLRSNRTIPAGSGIVVYSERAARHTRELMTELALDIRGITKRYADFSAVLNLSLAVPKGAVYGLLGPNGAGKTTSIRMILNIIAPDEGTITVFGRPNTDQASLDRIGYLPEERGLYKKMQVRRVLRFLAQLKGVGAKEADRRIDEWMQRFSLKTPEKDWGLAKIDELSRGMQQKVQFIGTLLHDPELVILDEPFSGLDPINAQALKDTVVDLRKRGKTVIFSTHLMDNAERLCDSVCIIARGEKVLDGTVAGVKQEHGGNNVALALAEGGADLVHRVLSDHKMRERVDDSNRFSEISLQKDADPQALLRRLIEAGAKGQRLELGQPSLHQIFLEKVGATGVEVGMSGHG